MLRIHPQFITDDNGKKSLMVLPTDEFDIIMYDLQRNEKAKKENAVERILLTDN